VLGVAEIAAGTFQTLLVLKKKDKADDTALDGHNFLCWFQGASVSSAMVTKQSDRYGRRLGVQKHFFMNVIE